MDNEQVTQTIDNSQDTSGVATQVGATQQGSEQHLFTQEQLNSIISGRINALNQKVTELSTQLEKSNKLTSQYHEELEGYKRKEVALKEGISAELVDYAIFGASKLVSKDKSFEDALKEFKASNATLFGVTQQASGSENGSTQTNNNGQQAQEKGQGTTQTTTVNMNNGQNVNSGSSNIDEEVKKFLETKNKYKR